MSQAETRTFPHPALEVDDDELDEVRAAGVTTPLGDLEAEMASEVEPEPITLEVPRRPGYAVRYSVGIDHNAELMAWRRQSAKKRPGQDEEVDLLKMAGLVLAFKCQAILRQGVEVTAAAGGPMTFRSPDFMAMFKDDKGAPVKQVREAIRRFYAGDAHVLAASDEVLATAGYGSTAQEAEGLGPTRA